MVFSLRTNVFAALSLLLLPVAVRAQYSVQSHLLNVDGDGVPFQVDWNLDGVPDFLGSNQTNQNLLSANGSYSYKTLVLPSIPQVTGDFNRDGNLDYATGSNGYLYTYLGNGKGGFTIGPSVTGPSGLGFVVADWNGDGRPDIAAAYDIPSSSTIGGGFGVAIYLNNGNGFDAGKTVFQTTYPVGSQLGLPRTEPGINAEMHFVDFALGDFDADGHADLMLRTLTSTYNTPEPIPTTTVLLLYGDGKGNFTAQTVASRDTFDQVTVADMNNDGTSDIVAVNGDTATIYYGHANRAFTSASVATPGGIYLEHMLVDINGDGLKDIVYPASCPSTYTCPDVPSGETPIGVITLTQTPAHTFTSTGFVQVQDVFSASYIGDFNHDGKLDVALHTGSEETGNYQPNDHLYVLANTRAGASYCPAPAGSGFHICSPASTASSTSVTFDFSASSIYPIRKLEVWVDGQKRSETYNSVGEQAFAHVALKLTAGKHNVSLYSGAYDGSVQKTSFPLTVK